MEGFSVVILILGVCFYFLPTIIASIRHSEHGSGIFWVNFLFGWTVLGWIAALMWAVTEKVEKRAITSLQAEQQAKHPEPRAPATQTKDWKIYAGAFAIGLAITILLAWLFKL